MKKMSTLFKVVYHNNGEPGIISNEIRSENSWVFSESDQVIATVKWDGTAAMIKDGVIFKRYDAKQGKSPPVGAIPCDEFPDPISGHWPHWVECSKYNLNDKYFIEAFGNGIGFGDGTYELCGEKIGTNAENICGLALYKHGTSIITTLHWSFDGIRDYLGNGLNNVEGIVFHHIDGRMCKIRKGDFGYERTIMKKISVYKKTVNILTVRKKPMIDFTSIKFTYSTECIAILQDWMGNNMGNYGINRHPDAVGWLEIRTLEDGSDDHTTIHIATAGDYIIKGSAGEFWAIKPNIFNNTYDIIE
jgi:hypothetical protein